MIAWSIRFIGPYHSAWSVIQMLEWMNCLTARPVGWGGRWRLRLAKCHVDIPFPSHASHSLEFEEIGRTLLQISDLLLEEDRRVSGMLRLCPICVQDGAHFAYQQDTRYVSCLLHGVELANGCPHCRRALRADGADCHGFRCGHCKRELLHAGLLRPLSTAKAEAYGQAGALASAWCALVTRMIAPLQRPGHVDWPGVDASEVMREPPVFDHWVLNWNRDHPVARALAPKPPGLSIRSAGPLRAAFSPDDGVEVRTEAIYELRALLRCVSRHIKSTYLKRHRKCLAVARRFLCRTRLDFEPCLTIQPALCPLAQAHVTWLAQRSLELDRFEVILRSQCSAAGLDASDEDLPVIRLPRPHAAAANWVSSFEALVSAIWKWRGIDLRLPSYMPLISLTRISWGLSQSHANRECPIHLRDSRIQEWAVCDRGGFLQIIEERARKLRSAQLRVALHLARQHGSHSDR